MVWIILRHIIFKDSVPDILCLLHSYISMYLIYFAYFADRSFFHIADLSDYAQYTEVASTGHIQYEVKYSATSFVSI